MLSSSLQLRKSTTALRLTLHEIICRTSILTSSALSIMSSCSTAKGSSPESSTTSSASSASSASSPTRSSNGDGLLKDIYLWRKKKLTASVLVVSTATWVMLEVYRFNLVPVVCWVAIFVITSMFLWGNLARLLQREKPAMAIWEVSEKVTMDTQDALRGMMEDGIRWMFRVGVEERWIIFFEILAGLWLLSVAAGSCSFVSFSYVGVVIGLTVPFICFKFDDKIKGLSDRVKMQGRRWYQTVEDKFHSRKESEHKVAEEKKKKSE